MKKPTTDAEKLAFVEQSLVKLFDKNFKLFLDDNLYDLGIDSLDIVELQLNFEETFDIVLDDPIKPPQTVRDLIKLM